MPKKDSEKEWQRHNPHKVEQYRQKYLSDKKQVSLVLQSWVLEAIDKTKPPEQPYGAWVRELVETWAKSQGT